MPTTKLHLTGRPPHTSKDDIVLAGQNITVEEARDLVSSTRRKPWQGDKTVVHITASHRVKEPVWNTLLKSLEEPPPYVEFHLYAPSTDAIPGTVKSRSHVTREHLPDPQPEDATRILRLCQSGDALTLLREADRHQDSSDAFSTLSGLQHIAARTGDVDLAALTDYYKTLLGRHVSPRVVMKACFILLAQRIRSAS